MALPRLPSLLGAVILLFAGCSQPAAPPPDPAPPTPDTSWAERALAYGPYHDHGKREDHLNLSTSNFEVLGYDPLISPLVGHTGGGHLCGDANATLTGKRIAAVESRIVGGIEIADVTDPLHPKWLGELAMRSTRVYDVAVVPDGRHVVVVTTSPSLSTPGVDMTPELTWRSACAPEPIPLWRQPSEPVPRHSSILVISIEEPGQPRIVDDQPFPIDGHSVVSTIIDGRTWVLGTGILQSSYYYAFYELLDTADGAHLEPLAVHLTGNQPLAAGGHDGAIAKHPLTGQTLAYLTAGSNIEILDLADPRQPRLVGRWSSAGPGVEAEFQHSTVPLPEARDGRHYTVVGPELEGHPPGKPTGTIWILDTTDPAAPKALGGWTLPVEIEWKGDFMFSNHYLAVVNWTVFVTMYHGGVWAFDFSGVVNGTFQSLPSVGVFLPDRVSPKPPAVKFRWTPTVEDVLAMPDGTLVTFDGSSGLYTFRFDAFRPAPPPTPWPLTSPQGG